MELSVDECLRIGLHYVRYTDKRQKVCRRTYLECFKTQYGYPPEAVARAMNDNPHIDRKKFFMTLSWFQLYDTEFDMESRWDWHPEMMIRNILYDVCMKLAARKAEKIVFGGFEPDQELLAGIDCVHFICHEFRTDPGGKWYSHKSNGPGLSYEVCVDAVKDRIVWANGPFPAATHDITIFRGGLKKQDKHTWNTPSLYHLVPAFKRLVGDSGYVGEPEKIPLHLVDILPKPKNCSPAKP
jgi:hypothetical protein